MTSIGAPLLAVGTSPNTPGGTTADFSAPWLDLFDDAFGWLMATAVFVFAICAVVGLIMWVAGKLGSSGRGQGAGLTVFGIGIVAAILTAVVGSIIMWATDLGPDWFNF